jgi:small acid-soluble spore protein (thioredoxin-like protein)
MTKPKPDDRRDNVDKIQRNIDNTNRKIRESEEMIASSDNRQTQHELEAKNDRRRHAIDGFVDEIKDEAHDKKKGYK